MSERGEQVGHTPGPWEAGALDVTSKVLAAIQGDARAFVVRAEDQYAHRPGAMCVVALCGGVGNELHQRSEADARLIALAPDLATLVVEALDLVPRISDDEPMATTLLDWCRRARTAIAKAAGVEP